MSHLSVSTDNMLLLESSSFSRGSTIFGNESPVRIVKLQPFFIDIYPVTNSDFSDFIKAGGYEKRELWSKKGWDFIQKNSIKTPNYWNNDLWNQPNMPVTGVSWWESMAYASFVNKELPTEAQWEYAAGFGNRTYPWGNASPTNLHANFAPGCEPPELNRRATGVNELELNTSASGCRDMAGNVGEWCLDNASLNYEWDTTGLNPFYITKEEDPHIVRGGSGLHDEDCLRCASRDYYPPELRDNIVGLRCIINLQEK